MKIRKKGFTLLEILTVLVIVASVMAFGLPAYRRAQEKVAYQAATGLLRDVGASWQLLMQDTAEAGIQWLAPYNRYVLLVEPSSASLGCGSSLSECAASSPLHSDAFRWFLLKQYMSPIPWDNSRRSTYKGYRYYVCEPGVNCCYRPEAIACMFLKSSTNHEDRATGGLYIGASVDKAGNIKQFEWHDAGDGGYLVVDSEGWDATNGTYFCSSGGESCGVD
ncbi:MAG: prepilin-type N-terminal cleavage/methylation domain-containing protein [Elusimicrobiaceae bacterium]|nr:prepilin-type N-terminal cleavage/methylation domain-containing protein [Elusimicrobiaceae bacterium]